MHREAGCKLDCESTCVSVELRGSDEFCSCGAIPDCMSKLGEACS